MALPAMVIPSKTQSACSESSTRSLKVPGSASSALQTTYFSGAAAEAAGFP